MANENMFEQIFSPIGQGIRGVARGLFPGAASAADLDRKRIQALLDSAEGQQLLSKARAASLNRGEGYYGGRGVDPYVKGSEDLGKIRAARDKFAGDELTPETAAYFTAAEKSVLDRMKSEVDPIDRAIKVAGGRKTLPKTDNRDFFGPGEEFLEMSKEYDRLGDYFQAPTETVPEGNIPKTFPQMGIESIDDQAVLSEMQQALPDVDMKSEYESDPEMMNKLMELWRAKKLTKQNLHKAFSMIQQSAQQSLGIR